MGYLLLRRSLLAFAALALVVPLASGCGGAGLGPESGKSPVMPAARQGVVMGGEQPVSGATIQLYAVGTTGDGSAATALLSPAATTDGNGHFDITGDYSCPMGDPLVYIVATGGDPGLGADNPNLSLMAALGPCDELGSSSYIVINELTTVGAVYPLAPFMASPAAIGSGTNDSGMLESAFTLALELVNPTTGTSPGASVPAGTTVPVAQIDTIADILASCIDTAGGTSGDGSACGTLFAMTTPSTTPATAPVTNTIVALLNLANNPALNTAALYALASPTAPFQPIQTAAPPGLGVQVNAPSTLYVTPSSLSFATWVEGYAAPSQTVGIMNYNPTTIPLNATISGPDASSFGISGGTCGTTLAAQGYCTYQIDFSPAGGAGLNAFFLLSSSSANPLIEIPLTGAGVAANAGPVVLSPSSLSFTVAGTRQDIQVENYGTTPLIFSSATFSNLASSSNSYPNLGYFSQTNDCGTGVPAQSVCTISVESTGLIWDYTGLPVSFTGTMTILDNATAGPQTVSLTSTDTARVSGGTGQVTLSSGSYYSGASATYAIGGADPGDF